VMDTFKTHCGYERVENVFIYLNTNVATTFLRLAKHRVLVHISNSFISPLFIAITALATIVGKHANSARGSPALLAFCGSTVENHKLVVMYRSAQKRYDTWWYDSKVWTVPVVITSRYCSSWVVVKLGSCCCCSARAVQPLCSRMHSTISKKLNNAVPYK
jgi:hypothetical protein